ncbi:hypothetical protein VCRA2113O415_160062 [Vibrio crassostreae]|nr:hypothetical protein VCRA211O406_80130 [Vibrio crassostreae]CAK2417221.1 hypothetical protein VCRA2113O415_160062 [Vibrio crassostreae]CAK2528722.1 hypothetical protein VCRA2113O420_100100 [Vibrio crassostreae]CAK3108228.1 hypothetical protein VCRA2121O436_100100 [Vibrio crassostreae]CAK3529904.1 hypothetical protein VCRA2123O443_90130 [Vibrio crassostreae]
MFDLAHYGKAVRLEKVGANLALTWGLFMCCKLKWGKSELE